jgi:hypothetical protein
MTRYPAHILVLTQHPARIDFLTLRFEKITVTTSFFQARTIGKTNSFQLILIDNPSKFGLIGLLLKHIFKVPLCISVTKYDFSQSWLKKKVLFWLLKRADSLRLDSNPSLNLKSYLISHKSNFFISPLHYDLSPYYKPATYHPIIKETNLFMPENNDGWGEARIRAIASGKAEVSEPTRMNYLKTHPEEVYRIAKNDQQYLKLHLESDILPDYFAKKLYEICHST